ncbi:MAG: dihydroneopterin aldolase [Actinomycetota bacterium]
MPPPPPAATPTPNNQSTGDQSTGDEACTIVVRGLRVDAYIGVLDSEHGVRQRVQFDVEVDTVPGYLHTVRASGDYVSYADVVEYIEGRAATDEHVELVETWADDIAGFVLSHPLATAVRVTVQKLDIFERAAGVGIVLDRRHTTDDQR